MSGNTAGAEKLCIVCGMDCTGKPRTKDRQGRYFCQPCYQKALARARSKQVGSPTAAPVAQSPTPRPRPRSAVADDLSTLASLEGAAAVAEIGHACPRCGAEIPHRKTVCKACGHDTRPHTPTPIARKKATEGEPREGGGATASTSMPNFLQSPKIVGLIQAGVLLGLFALAKSSAGLFPLYMLVACVYGLGVGLWALVAAFRTSVGTGFLTLCVPFYAFYFVYAKSGNPFLQGSYTVAFINMILFRVSMPAESLPFEDY